MSILKTNTVQIGQSLTASNNFTLTVPSTPDGSIKLSRGNPGATIADVFTIDEQNNVAFDGDISLNGISVSNEAVNSAVANGGYSKTIVKNSKGSKGACIVINNKVFVSGLCTAYIGKNGSQSQKKNFTEIPFKDAHLIPNGTTISQVAFTGINVYVILSNGWVYSWGVNNQGQCGSGNTTNIFVLTRIEFFVSNSLSVTNVWTTRSVHTDDPQYATVFFKTSNGNTYSCGYNNEGQCGLGNTTTPISTPTRVTALQDVTMLSLGAGAGAHGLAVCSAAPRSVYAWGYNGTGQCGNGTTTNITTPVITYTHATDNIQQVEAVGSPYYNGTAWITSVSRSYILVGGTIKSVGENTVGPALGIGNTTNQSSWQNVPTLTGITKIETNSGYYGSCYALNATTGTLYACGHNGYGELGDGTTTNRSSFITSIASGCVDVIAAGHSTYNSVVAKMSDGSLQACGYNGVGTLGLGLATFTAANSTWQKIALPMGANVVDIHMIYDLANRYDGMLLVLMDDGGLYACGPNVNNSLSTNEETVGHNTDSLTMVQLIYK